MPTKEPRLNVVLDKETRGIIAQLAKRHDKTLSDIAAGLIRDALEVQEDVYFSNLAEERRKDTRPPIPHDEFWKLAKKKIRK